MLLSECIELCSCHCGALHDGHFTHTLQPSKRGAWKDVLAGLKYVRKRPSIMFPLIMMGTLSLLAMNFNILVPTLAKVQLNIGVTGYGTLMTFMDWVLFSFPCICPPQDLVEEQTASIGLGLRSKLVLSCLVCKQECVFSRTVFVSGRYLYASI